MAKLKQSGGTRKLGPERDYMLDFPVVKIVPGSHVIKRYRAAEDTIECECGWKGEQTKFPAHRKEALPKKES